MAIYITCCLVFQKDHPYADADGLQLLQAVISQLIPFIRSSNPVRAGGANHLVDPLALDPHILNKLLREDATLPDKGQGQEGLLRVLEKVLKYSVNTWNEGFMDKLYASTNAVSNPWTPNRVIAMDMSMARNKPCGLVLMGDG